MGLQCHDQSGISILTPKIYAYGKSDAFIFFQFSKYASTILDTPQTKTDPIYAVELMFMQKYI